MQNSLLGGRLRLSPLLLIVRLGVYCPCSVFSRRHIFPQSSTQSCDGLHDAGGHVTSSLQLDCVF